MKRGFTKNYRRRFNHPLYKKPLIWHFFDYCIGRANFEKTVIDFNGSPIELERGSFIMSLDKAKKATGLSTQNIRTAIKTLVNHSMIEKSTKSLTKQATMINVCNYEVYQAVNNEANKASNKVPTKCQQSPNKVLTIDKNVKRTIKNELRTKKPFVENSNEFQLAKLLSDLILQNNPDNKSALKSQNDNYQKWADEIRKMNQIDNRKFDQIKYLINWSQKDHFWMSNILSPAKLRAQFDSLIIQVKKGEKKKQSIKSNSLESLVRKKQNEIEVTEYEITGNELQLP